MRRKTVIELNSAKMGFSAGHFTIFSATEREPMHGHNYRVSAVLTVTVAEDDIAFDYTQFKSVLMAMCAELDYYFLLPERSPHLQLRDDGDYLHATFNGEIMTFLKKDIKVLAVGNITLEGLANWFLEKTVQQFAEVENLLQLTIKVFNGPSQSAAASHQFSG